MKSQSRFFLLLVIPLLFTGARAAQYIPPNSPNVGSWTITDTNDPLDLVTFYSNGQFIVTPNKSSKVLASGVYQQNGTGLVLVINGSPGSGFGPKTANPAETFSGSGDFSFLDQIIDTNGNTPALGSNGKPIVPSGPLTVGGTSNFAATVTDNGNSIVIFSDSIAGFNSLLYGHGGQILLGGGLNGGGSGGNGGNNNGNGTGNPTDPPGGPGDPSAAPEPSTWVLLISSLVGLLLFRRFRFGRR